MVLVHENKFVNYTFKKPILYVTIKKLYPEEDEWNEAVKLMKSYYDSACIGDFRFSIIFDLRKIGLLEHKYYQEWANLFIEKKEMTEKYIIKTCIITSSTILRTSLNAFFTIYKTVRPFCFVGTLDEAETFINKPEEEDNNNESILSLDMLSSLGY